MEKLVDRPFVVDFRYSVSLLQRELVHLRFREPGQRPAVEQWSRIPLKNRLPDEFDKNFVNVSLAS